MERVRVEIEQLTERAELAEKQRDHWAQQAAFMRCCDLSGETPPALKEFETEGEVA